MPSKWRFLLHQLNTEIGTLRIGLIILEAIREKIFGQ